MPKPAAKSRPYKAPIPRVNAVIKNGAAIHVDQDHGMGHNAHFQPMLIAVTNGTAKEMKLEKAALMLTETTTANGQVSAKNGKMVSTLKKIDKKRMLSTSPKDQKELTSWPHAMQVNLLLLRLLTIALAQSKISPPNSTLPFNKA